MKDRPILFGSLAAGLLASACCIGPLLLGAIGLGSLGFGAWLAPARPWFLALTGLLLAIGFYLAYRPVRSTACEAGEACATPESRRPQRIMLWSVTLIAAGLATYPSWAARSGSGSTPSGARDPSDTVVTLAVSGMTCEACAGEIEQGLTQVRGVLRASVDYDHSRAQIVTAAAINPRLLISAVERTGYHASIPASTRSDEPKLATAGSTTDGESQLRRPLVQLNPALEPFVRDFNSDQERTRFVAILSPTCQSCLEGAKAIKAALGGYDPKGLSIYVVWTPMLAGDGANAARGATLSMRGRNVRNYYDPRNELGAMLRRDAFPKAASDMVSSLPRGHFMIEQLRRRDPTTPEWDIYMLFDPHVVWRDAAPRPSHWVRQAARFGPPGGEMKSLMWIDSYRTAPISGDLSEQIAQMAKTKDVLTASPQ